MKELVIISGKGGTGKTSLTAAFCSLAENSVFCDADVDAADLHLLMAPEIKQRSDFIGGCKAEINQEQCTQCGKCIELCRFGAINESYQVDGFACEGCGVCVDLCPVEAIDFPEQKCGEWFVSETRFGPLVHARLGIGEENSGKLVSLIRKKTKELAEKKGHDFIITDGPPGIGCPVIASITGATALVIVVEPSLSGIHDMKRVSDLAAHFKVPAMVCVNKYDLNIDMTQTIEKIAAERNNTILGRIPFDPVFTHAMVYGMNIFEYQEQTGTQNKVKTIWDNIMESLTNNSFSGVKLRTITT